MTDYTLFVGVDIAAKTATVAWGRQANRLSTPLTLKQTPVAWQGLVDKLSVLSPDPKTFGGNGSHRHLLDADGFVFA